MTFDLFLTAPYVPFTIALGLLFGLLAVEVVLALLGGTLFGLGANTDAVPTDLADLELGFDTSDLLDVELTEFEIDTNPGQVQISDAGPTTWLGFGQVPFLIWCAALLLGFGLGGLLVQQISFAILGFTLPALLAVGVSGAIGTWFARTFSGFFASLLPKTETTALSERHLGRRTGVVTQGNAQRGRPAEVRVTDRYGNIHHLRGEPLKDDEVIAQGAAVLVLRHRRDQGYRLVELPTDA